MALSKVTYAGFDTYTLTSGSGWVASSAIDLRGSYGAIACMGLMNDSGTAGAAAHIGVEIGVDENDDGSADKWYWYGGAWSIGTTGSTSAYTVFELPFGIEWARFNAYCPTMINATAEGWIVSIEDI
jgi:hypothetical protein